MRGFDFKAPVIEILLEMELHIWRLWIDIWRHCLTIWHQPSFLRTPWTCSHGLCSRPRTGIYQKRRGRKDLVAQLEELYIHVKFGNELYPPLC